MTASDKVEMLVAHLCDFMEAKAEMDRLRDECAEPYYTYREQEALSVARDALVNTFAQAVVSVIDARNAATKGEA